MKGMAATTLLTSEQFLALPEELDEQGNRIKDELIGGEVVKMPPPSLPHDLIKNRINRILLRYMDAHPEVPLESLVEIGASVSDYDTFIPDISIVRRERLTPVERRIFQGAPDLAIEVVSPSDTMKHMKRKIDAYLANGSESVWVVFPDARSVMVHRAGSVHEFKPDQTLADPLLPGFSIPVAQFFELT
ncbi:MAG TPA: Uma2 family endonuclease [Bryobacteraceae bacterium]|nr:Uma2 family endonuclease [Bryobacteraceae bacterium]